MKGEKCWRCGKSKKIQKHHAIPKSMNPIKNQIIPLCDKCHKELHGDCGLVNKQRRMVIYFNNVKQPDGTYKLQSNIDNGKICFVDRSENTNVKPLVKYDCLIRETNKVAFARDIHPINKEIKKLGLLDWLRSIF